MQRETLNLSLPTEVINRIKNTVYWANGWTIGELVTAACNKVLSEIEKARGEAFPDRGDHLMRKGPQSYLPRTQLLDLAEWITPPEQRQAVAISVLREAVSEIVHKASFRSKWLGEEMETLFNTKLIDMGTSARVGKLNEEQTASPRRRKEDQDSQTSV